MKYILEVEKVNSKKYVYKYKSGLNAWGILFEVIDFTLASFFRPGCSFPVWKMKPVWNCHTPTFLQMAMQKEVKLYCTTGKLIYYSLDIWP